MGRFGFFLLIAGLALAVIFLSDRFPGTREDDYSFARIIYLGMLLVLVGPGVVYAYRGNASRAWKNIGIWGVIFAVAFVAMAYREEFVGIGAHLQSELMPSAPQSGGGAEVRLKRAEGGHFYADAYVNGERVRFLVDTGASRVALSYEDARRIGIETESLNYTIPVSTANGMTLNAATELDYVMIGDLRIEKVKASVARKGQMDGSLLGMSLLERLQGFRVEGNTLLLW